MTTCLCECPGCPLLPHCDGCDPPRLATWSGTFNGCDVCVEGNPLDTQGMVRERPRWYARCEGREPDSGICSLVPMTPEEEARLRAAFSTRVPYWNRDVMTLELLATIDAARRERDAARVEVEQAQRMAYEARAALHAALCEGAFKIDRDPMALQPVFYALQGQHVSCGWARTAVRRWLAGLPVQVPEYATEDLTFKACDALEHLQRIAAGLEYDTDGRAHILDTDVAVLRGAICGLREKAADLASEVERLRVEVAELRANVDPSR